MDVIRKCTVCGSTNFVSIGLSDSDGGAIMESINAFACTKCGHVEFFVKEEYLQAKVEEEEQRTLAALKKESDRKELMKLREEREKLLSIAEDEDQTLRSIKAAREKLVEINARIKHLEALVK